MTIIMKDLAKKIRQSVGKVHTRVSIDDSNQVNVQYHDTIVVSCKKLGTGLIVTLANGGFKTTTTKRRINQALEVALPGAYVFQKDFQWFVSYNGIDKKWERDSFHLQEVIQEDSDTDRKVFDPFLSLEDIEQIMTRQGSFWFSPDTMKFWGCNLGYAFQGKNGVFFSTSQKDYAGARIGKVYEFVFDTEIKEYRIRTIEETNNITQAHALAKKLSKEA